MRMKNRRTHTLEWTKRRVSRDPGVALGAWGLLALILFGAGCAHGHGKAHAAPEAGKDAAQLWVDPADLESRDLFLGPGGREGVPDPAVSYRIVGYDTTGHSHGYDVEDDRRRKWRVKMSEEAQSEVVASRVLWAIGYHQPVLHYVKSWHLTGGKPEDDARPGRFRLDSDHKNAGTWSWGKDNPFYGTRELHGLIVANLILNNWDFGPDQNRIYTMKGDRRD